MRKEYVRYNLPAKKTPVMAIKASIQLQYLDPQFRQKATGH